MKSENKNLPAFPIVTEDADALIPLGRSGLSKREYVATEIAASLLSNVFNTVGVERDGNLLEDAHVTLDRIATLSLRMADILLKKSSPIL